MKADCNGACIVAAPEVGFEGQELSRCFFTRLKVVLLLPCLQQPSLFSIKRLCKVGTERRERGEGKVLPALTRSFLPQLCDTLAHATALSQAMTQMYFHLKMQIGNCLIKPRGQCQALRAARSLYLGARLPNFLRKFQLSWPRS